MALDRLGREVEPGGDLLGHVAAGDQLQHFALARRQLVELGIASYALARAKRVECEAGETRRKDGVALGHTLYCARVSSSPEIVFVTYPVHRHE